MTIEVGYSVDADEEEIQSRLFVLGNLIINEMRRLAREMDLLDGGDFSQGFIVDIKDGVLIIENRTEYAIYLEYGTYEYWKRFGLEKFPKTPDPKKKDLPDKLKRQFPKGMQPFAVMRRVLYNKQLMNRLISRVFS